MSESPSKEEIDANHELVFRHKLDFVNALSGMDLSASEIKVAIYLGCYRANGSTGKCNPKVKTIAADTGLSVSGAEKAIGGLKRKGIIFHVVKGKSTSHYFLKMPELSEKVRAAREENSKKPAKQNPPKRAGNNHPNGRVSYEQGKRTREGIISDGAGHRDGFAGPLDSFPSIDEKAVAGSRDASTVDSDIGIKREEKINPYQAMKYGEDRYPVPSNESDLSVAMNQIISECGDLDNQSLCDLRCKLMASELTGADIAKARAAA